MFMMLWSLAAVADISRQSGWTVGVFGFVPDVPHCGQR
jgi:hypothetical protein